MAASTLRTKPCYHARSISLPSRSNPVTTQFIDHLDRLKTTSCSLSSISERLSGLQGLYDCVNDLLQLPQTQQAIGQNQTWPDEASDRYISLLDVCAIAKDALSKAKQDVQDLQSILRRKRDAYDVDAYLASRKKSKKTIQRSLKNFKSTKNQKQALPAFCDDTFILLKETEDVTIEVLESLLSSVACRITRKSVFHMLKPSASQNGKSEANEFDKVDAALKAGHSENLGTQLAKMETNIQVIEEELECLFRRLIKIRVLLLNIFNH